MVGKLLAQAFIKAWNPGAGSGEIPKQNEDTFVAPSEKAAKQKPASAAVPPPPVKGIAPSAAAYVPDFPYAPTPSRTFGAFISAVFESEPMTVDIFGEQIVNPLEAKRCFTKIFGKRSPVEMFERVWPSLETAPPTLFFCAVPGFDDSVEFLDFLKIRGEVARIVIKKRTKHHAAAATLRSKYRELDSTNNGLNDFVSALMYDPSGRSCIIVDHGGCFIPVLKEAFARLGREMNFASRILGIVEFCSSGAKRYKDFCSEYKKTFPFPIVTLCLSAAKEAQNIGVANDLVNCSLGIIERDGLPAVEKAGVIGFGKLGRNVVKSLRQKGLPVHAYDKDAVRALEIKADAREEGPPLTLAMTREELVRACPLIFAVTDGDSGMRLGDERFITEKLILSSATSFETSYPGFHINALRIVNEQERDRTKTHHVRVESKNIAFLTLGNAPNLASMPEGYAEETQRLHAHAIEVIKMLAREIVGRDVSPCATLIDSETLLALWRTQSKGKRNEHWSWHDMGEGGAACNELYIEFDLPVDEEPFGFCQFKKPLYTSFSCFGQPFAEHNLDAYIIKEGEFPLLPSGRPIFFTGDLTQSCTWANLLQSSVMSANLATAVS